MYWWIAKGVGWDNVPRRIVQSVSVRSGWLRKKLAPERFSREVFPCNNLTDSQRGQQWQERLARFFPIPTAEQLHELVLPQLWQESVTDICTRAMAGEYFFFSHSYEQLGWPPDFNLDPLNSIDWPIGEHWLDTARSGPPRNDIKLVWEASRCSLAFYLARQYRYSLEPVWAERLWEFIEAWIEQNPVNQTVAWGCGQETAFRLMALLTSVFATLQAPATSIERLAKLELLCWQSAKRIEANINYAISQENNHAFSEALGLWTVGLLFPEFPESARWVRRGECILERETIRQIYDDGSYVQHSMSYHRVMLDDLCWAIQLGRINGRELSNALVESVGRATSWLGQFVNADNGRVPNYGANDGANVLPLSCSDYLDYRPTLQAAEATCNMASQLAPGSWSEKTLWLTGRVPTNSAKTTKEDRWIAKTGGYYVMRGPNSLLMTRATCYRDRPGQCDQLHIDLWIAGFNILRDAGSFRYFHEDPLIKNYFYSVAAHNTIQIGNLEQMTKGPNFLWFNWPQASAFFDEGELRCNATFTTAAGYSHFRNVSRDRDSYTVVDSTESGEAFTARWRLAPELEWRQLDATSFSTQLPELGSLRLKFESDSDLPIKVSLTQSWESLYYAEKTPCPAIEVTNPSGSLTTRVMFSVIKEVPGTTGPATALK